MDGGVGSLPVALLNGLRSFFETTGSEVASLFAECGLREASSAQQAAQLPIQPE